MHTGADSITVVGAGVAGFSFLEKLRTFPKKVKLTLIDEKEFYFPKAQISQDLLDLQLGRKTGEWAESLQVDFVCAKVEKINDKARKITLSNAEKVEFDSLVVATGAVNEKIEIKGGRRQGFFYLSEINPKDLKVLLKIYNEVSVLVSTEEGIRFSLFLSSLGKEVRVIAPSLEFLGSEKEKTIDTLGKNRVNLALGYTLGEAIGEKNIKAIKVVPVEGSFGIGQENMQSIKVYSCQLVFIDTRLKPNLTFFKDSEGFLKKEGFFTKYNQAYIIGDAANAEIDKQSNYMNNSEAAKKSGIFLAEYLAQGCLKERA